MAPQQAGWQDTSGAALIAQQKTLESNIPLRQLSSTYPIDEYQGNPNQGY